MPTLGYQWLAHTYACQPIQPFNVRSAIGRTRSSIQTMDVKHEIYTESYRPEATLAGQLTFAFRYEGIHLEFLSRLFGLPAVKPELEAWVRREPTGAYARRAGFLYEWLTANRLDAPDLTRSNYVDALNPDDFLTGATINNPRWRVRDNLPGNRDFCPLVRRDEAVKGAERYDLDAAIRRLENDFGADLLQRSTVWLTIKESRASFLIEREQEQEDRIRRFAVVMETECGRHDDPFAAATLELLQRGILGEQALRYGIRRSPVYVGHSSRYQPVVDYIAPHWEQVNPMLSGLSCHLHRTQGASSLIRAATAAFGFVYLHPMADGNGRISRFLVNDILRRDGMLQPPWILPVSATITHSTRNRADYDRVLEVFSRPLMQRFADRFRFGEMTTGEDGIPYNFHFDGYDEALPAWRYPDLTRHAVYLARVVEETLEHEMREEATFLRAHDRARTAVKCVLEMPDPELDRIIRSVQQNGGTVSNKLLKLYPVFGARPGLAERVSEVIREAFEEAG